MFFFECDQFYQRGVSFDNVQKLLLFVKKETANLDTLGKELDDFVTQATIEKKERVLKEREEQMSKKSVEEAKNDVEDMFADLQEGL